VASGIYDTTCGIMEELEVYNDDGLGVFGLDKTSYPMSRNRNFAVTYVAIVAVLILLYHFIVRRKKTDDKKIFRLETDLLILGVIALLVDEYIDIWLFHWTGPWLLVIIHVIAISFVAWRFGLWFVLPLLELFWAGSLASASRSIIPQLAFSPALIIVWFAILQFMSFKKRLGETDSS